MNSTAEEGDVRLVGGSRSCSGRVEIYHVGQWGTVCSRSFWDLPDAQVVCRQLGCGRALTATRRADFGLGSGPVWLGQVSCSGSESNLTECSHQGFSINNCIHDFDAGVVCEGECERVNAYPPMKNDTTTKSQSWKKFSTDIRG